MESYTTTEISGDATKDVNAHVLEIEIEGSDYGYDSFH